jgi:hypothetical protein
MGVRGPSHEELSSHGWRRHSAAVARSSGSNASIGSRKSANCCAADWSQSYFSDNTSCRLHGFNFVMCRSSPEINFTYWLKI